MHTAHESKVSFNIFKEILYYSNQVCFFFQLEIRLNGSIKGLTLLSSFLHLSGDIPYHNEAWVHWISYLKVLGCRACYKLKWKPRMTIGSQSYALNHCIMYSVWLALLNRQAVTFRTRWIFWGSSSVKQARGHGSSQTSRWQKPEVGVVNLVFWRVIYKGRQWSEACAKHLYYNPNATLEWEHHH